MHFLLYYKIISFFLSYFLHMRFLDSIHWLLLYHFWIFLLNLYICIRLKTTFNNSDDNMSSLLRVNNFLTCFIQRRCKKYMMKWILHKIFETTQCNFTESNCVIRQNNCIINQLHFIIYHFWLPEHINHEMNWNRSKLRKNLIKL